MDGGKCEDIKFELKVRYACDHFLVIPIEFEIKLRYVCDHFGTMSLENAVSIDPKSGWPKGYQNHARIAKKGSQRYFQTFTYCSQCQLGENRCGVCECAHGALWVD